MKKFLSTIILIAAIICFCWSAFSLGRYAWQTWVTQKNVNDLASEINDTPLLIDEADPNTDETINAADQAALDAEAMMAKYSNLYNRNQDFIGWLSIEGTNINYPVMYTPYDPQHYLRRNFDGDYDIGGMLFADYRCSFDPASTDIIIYGHHMKNGTMFGPLMDFKDVDYLQAHSTVTFDTLYRPGTYRIFASSLSAAYDDTSDEFKYYNFITADSEEELAEYLNNIKALSLYYDEDNAPVFGDEILTLSTCDYTQDDGRFAVLAKRIR